MSQVFCRQLRWGWLALNGLLAMVLAAGSASMVRAQQAPPSPADVLGWELGERFSDVAAVQRYLAALAEASPLVSISEYGRSVEGRALTQVLIAAPQHRARLDEILKANQTLTDPDLTESEARSIIETNPAVVYFSYGVHGNESSSSEAAMWTAWDLARGAAEVEDVLDSVVVVIDPIVNPDGRDRYVNFYRAVRGLEPNPDPDTREHREPWPGGRTNHYYFDLNRDWAWVSQPETRARLATWPTWNPQVHVDFHEMSPNSSYFFFPPAAPVNPLYPEHTARWARRIGEANAAAFSRQGWLFFTEESYDLFYPGYGDSWPSLLGSIGMTYEQAGGGSAGLAYARGDGDVLTLRDRATHHRVAGQATLRAAATGRTDLLSGFVEFHRDVDAGLPDVLLVPDSADGGARLRGLLAELDAQAIDYEVAGRAFTVSADVHEGFAARRSFPIGTVRVRARQPRGRLALTLLQARIPLEAAYSYDISAWSRPYAFGVEAHVAAANELARVGEWQQASVASLNAATGAGAAGQWPNPLYGVVLKPGFERMPALVRFLAEGGRGRVMLEPMEIAGEVFAAGSIFLPSALNRGLAEALEAAGLDRVPEVVAVSSSLTTAGPDLGTGSATELQLPRVALVGGEGTSSNSFGAHRFFLERRLGLPHDVIEARELGSLALEKWDVIVVPEGAGTGRALSERDRNRVREWVQRGGTLVAVGSGAAGLEALTGVARREAAEQGDPTERALRTLEERELSRWEDRTPGAVVAAQLDRAHPLAFGAAVPGGDRVFVLSAGNAFEPSEEFESAAWFGEDLERVSGVISDTTLGRLSRSAWLVQRSLGRGRMVLFADDPLFRMMWPSAFQLYANAVLIAPTL